MSTSQQVQVLSRLIWEVDSISTMWARLFDNFGMIEKLVDIECVIL